MVRTGRGRVAGVPLGQHRGRAAGAFVKRQCGQCGGLRAVCPALPAARRDCTAGYPAPLAAGWVQRGAGACALFPHQSGAAGPADGRPAARSCRGHAGAADLGRCAGLCRLAAVGGAASAQPEHQQPAARDTDRALPAGRRVCCFRVWRGGAGSARADCRRAAGKHHAGQYSFRHAEPHRFISGLRLAGAKPACPAEPWHCTWAAAAG